MIKKILITFYAIVIVVMAMATLFPQESIYGSWWFTLIWGCLTLSGVCYILRRKLYKRPATFFLHLSFVVILIGALVTHVFSEQGAVALRLGASTSTFITKEGKKVDLPFSLRLTDFHVINYAGTDSPMDYSSKVDVHKEGKEPQHMSISMNNIGEIDGYRFYQASYDSDGKGSVLSVSHDPWGIGITYTGYGLFLLSVILIMVSKREGFRLALQNYRKALSSATLLLAFLIGGVTTASAEPKTFDRETAEQFGNLYVYYNGRICPMSTLAHDVTLKLHGSTTYKDFNENQILSGWIFFPTSWIDEPYIKIKGGAKDALGTENKYVSYMQFLGAEGYRLESVMNDIHSGKSVSGSRDITDADEKVNILRMIFSGELMKTFPYQDKKGNVHWVSSGDRLPKYLSTGQWMFIRKGFDYCTELAVTHQDGDLHILLSKIKQYQEKEASKVLPDEDHFKAEELYNKLGYTLQAALLLVIVAFLGMVIHSSLIDKLKCVKNIQNVFRLLSIISAVVVGVYLIVVISLRGYISGYLPLSNGYETMQFMALVAVVIALLPFRVFRAEYALLVSALALFVSLMDESNPQLTQMMPVLHSPLLSIHVCVIMLAYALLAIALFLSVESIVTYLLHSSSKELMLKKELQSRVVLYPAMACLGLGIFIGAIWANVSWGTYWSWDPKETWALITFMIYAVPLHKNSLPFRGGQGRGSLVYHLYMVLAFLSVLFTYFGVNYVLGGMHSYA